MTARPDAGAPMPRYYFSLANGPTFEDVDGLDSVGFGSGAFGGDRPGAGSDALAA